MGIELNGEIIELQGINSDLNERVTDLEDVRDDLNSTVTEYKTLNSDLVAITSFLSKTSIGLDKTLNETTAFLNTLILGNQQLVEQALELNMKAQIAEWDCD